VGGGGGGEYQQRYEEARRKEQEKRGRGVAGKSIWQKNEKDKDAEEFVEFDLGLSGYGEVCGGEEGEGQEGDGGGVGEGGEKGEDGLDACVIEALMPYRCVCVCNCVSVSERVGVNRWVCGPRTNF